MPVANHTTSRFIKCLHSIGSPVGSADDSSGLAIQSMLRRLTPHPRFRKLPDALKATVRDTLAETQPRGGPRSIHDEPELRSSDEGQWVGNPLRRGSAASRYH